MKLRENRIKEIQKKYTKLVPGMMMGRKCKEQVTVYEGIKERRCEYKPELTRLIIQDFMQKGIFYEDTRNDLLDIVKLVKVADDNICRMYDDKASGRDIIDFDFDAIESVFAKTEAVSDAHNELRELCDLLILRIMHMIKHSVVLKITEELDLYVLSATAQYFDADGNQIGGVSDEKKESIEQFAKLEKGFLHLYLISDIDSETEERAMKEADALDLTMQIIAEDKEQEFLRNLGKQGQ